MLNCAYTSMPNTDLLLLLLLLVGSGSGSGSGMRRTVRSR
jgi:hypothetical protein